MTRPEEARPSEIVQLETLLQCRLAGRVNGIRLVLRNGGLVILGQSRTYYGKQLAQQAVLESTRLPVVANEIHVS